MVNLQEIGVKVQKILLWAVMLSVLLSIAGAIGFFSVAYDAHTSYPKWSLYTQRTALYMSVVTLVSSLVSCITFPRRWKSFAFLVVSYFVVGMSLFLTQGDPFPVHDKRDIHVITDNTQEAKGK